MEDKIEQWVEKYLRMPKNLATESELREQSRVAVSYFKDADADQSGTLVFSELKLLCDHMGLPMENDEEEAMIKMDTDDSGALDIDEWGTWWLNRISSMPNPVKQQEAIARNTFKKFDKDGSGYIDAGELRGLVSALGAQFNDEEIEAAIAEMDTDQSGVIEVSEFIIWWTNRSLVSRSNVTSVVSLKLRKLAAKAAQVFHTDIFTAAWQGDEDLVKSFLESEARMAKAHDESDYGESWTALQYAAYQGHAGIVQLLLEAQANVNAQNKNGFTALFYAAQRGHLGICNMLMESQADPTLVGSHPEEQSLFLCALDHIVDYPALGPLFQNHVKCSRAPAQLETSQIEVVVAPVVFQLTLTLPGVSMKQLTAVPLQSYRVVLTVDAMDNPELMDDVPQCELLLPAPHPSRQPQTASGTIPISFIKFLRFFACSKKLNELSLQGSGKKMDVLALWEEAKSYFAAIDTAAFRKKVNLEEKFMNAMSRGSEDGSVVALRSSFRTFLAQNRGVDDGTGADATLTTEQLEEIVKHFVGIDEAHAAMTQTQAGAKDAVSKNPSQMTLATQQSKKTPAVAPPKAGALPGDRSAQAKSTQSLRPSTAESKKSGVKTAGDASSVARSEPTAATPAPVKAPVLRQTIQAQVSAVTALSSGALSDTVEVVVKL